MIRFGFTLIIVTFDFICMQTCILWELFKNLNKFPNSIRYRYFIFVRHIYPSINPETNSNL